MAVQDKLKEIGRRIADGAERAMEEAQRKLEELEERIETAEQEAPATPAEALERGRRRAAAPRRPTTRSTKPAADEPEAPSGDPDLEALRDAWEARWDEAIEQWSRFTRLSRPRWCLTPEDERREGLVGSFAMIRLDDHAVVISLRQIRDRKLSEFPVQVMAHEIGHHVYCPGDLTDQGRMLARMRVALPTKERVAPFVANLYADLLINNRLQRSNEVDMAAVFRRLKERSEAESPKAAADRLWLLYMRMYEVLWGLRRQTLTSGPTDERIDGDAVLGARLLRVYGKHWMDGSGRFAALLLPYLLEDEGAVIRQLLRDWMDTEELGADGFPAGLTEIEDGELDGALHPAHDPEISGLGGDEGSAIEIDDGADPGALDRSLNPDILGGRKKIDRYRGVIEYGELLEGLGIKLTPEEVAIRYYRERAMPHLIRFPVRELPKATDPLPEGLEPWDVGSPLQAADWFESVIKSPHVIPGLTTVQRTWGQSPGNDPETRPVNLYIGIDCSGSMPNPQRQVSYPSLAGVILALSALRAGAQVRCCLSGEPGKSVANPAFTRNEKEVLQLLCGYLGSGYAYGIHRLRDTFMDDHEPGDPLTHLLIITDQDIFSMLDDKHSGVLGWDLAEQALNTAGGGGTMVLNMPEGWRDPDVDRLKRRGWDTPRVADMAELVSFARAFSKKTFEDRP